MNDISKLPDELKNKAMTGLNKSKRRVAPTSELNNTPASQKDKAHVSPVNKWLEILNEMPQETADNLMDSHHDEHLKGIAEKLESGYYEKNFDEEVFPRLFNNLSSDWNIDFKGKGPKNR